VAWVAGYVLVAVAPLLLSLIQLDPGRGFWVNLSVSFGFVGLSLLGLQFALAARSVRVAQPTGVLPLLQFHREISYLVLVLILAHPIILVLYDSSFWSLFDVVHAPLRAQLAIASVLALLLLVATSVWRTRVRLSYHTWQVLHATLAVLIVATALAHVLLIGYYVDQPWERALWIVYSLAFVWISLWVRVVKPLQRWRRRWRVVEVREQPGDSLTIALELVHPDAYGPDGFQFEAGQFAWIMVGHSPFALTALTAAELRAGVALLPEGRRRDELGVRIESLLVETFAGYVLAFDVDSAAHYAEVLAARTHGGRPISTFDAQTAAVCRQYNSVLATRNTADFTDTGIPLVNPWDTHPG